MTPQNLTRDDYIGLALGTFVAAAICTIAIQISTGNLTYWDLGKWIAVAIAIAAATLFVGVATTSYLICEAMKDGENNTPPSEKNPWWKIVMLGVGLSMLARVLGFS